ncbi:LuxR C-terminal-related transcriptional regulator [Gorillibacterium sp. sgz5001074]|uniref:LuxR C-terminal-related transcriptional regulator n=1 Tax=Gorillibacterium sp. sgz5001074 TaxID=3446695 RepID=UPI003F66E4FF
MMDPLVATKLFIPALRSGLVPRERLSDRLNEGIGRKLTLVSAPAGSGKTTLVSEWLAGCGKEAAWISLDPADNDPYRFLTYLHAALQSLRQNRRDGLLPLLSSPQPPSVESVLAAWINEAVSLAKPFILVLDDYHLVRSEAVHQAMSYLMEHQPPQLSLVLVTREDPPLPLARLRVRNQLAELRVPELRFSLSEAEGFFRRTMGLKLAQEQVRSLWSRTEGWAAGLQLAALSLQSNPDAAGLLDSFGGSHVYLLDYLVEEVLQHQPPEIQTFLLQTSILDRMCGELCDVVNGPGWEVSPSSSSRSGQMILEALEVANLFVIPLDQERRWYRYHHLFADMLRARLQQQSDPTELHLRASLWLERNGMELEAFQHAVAAKSTERAASLAEGKGMPLIFRGAVMPVLQWLESLSVPELDARPSLWVIYASGLLLAGQTSGVESKLQAAERAIEAQADSMVKEAERDLLGHIASIRATLAVSRHDANVILAEANRALAYLHPHNVPVRTATTWALGYARQLLGDRAAAAQAYKEAVSSSRTLGHRIIEVMATLGLAMLQEGDNQLHHAAETYRAVLELAGDPPLPAACEAHLGLARIRYEWNEPESALEHGLESLRLARQLELTDRVVAGDLILARLKLAGGEPSAAASLLGEAEHLARRQYAERQLPLVAAAQVQLCLHEGNRTDAERLAARHDLPLISARVRLALGETSSSLAILRPYLEHAEAKEWEDEVLKAVILLALALLQEGATPDAVRVLRRALAKAEPGGFIRLFADEGPPMAELLSAAAAGGFMPAYTGRLLQVMKSSSAAKDVSSARSLVEPLSPRELEILRLIADGLSNQEICDRLHLALSSVKGYNRNIFGKLQAGRRTEAVARARELGLLP